MKKTLLIILSLWLSAMAFAGPVDLNQAKQNVLSFITAKNPAMARGNAIKTKLSLKVASQADGYYVFNLGDQEGFVIASSDDRTPAVLGYVEKGAFDSKNMPENMRQNGILAMDITGLEILNMTVQQVRLSEEALPKIRKL